MTDPGEDARGAPAAPSAQVAPAPSGAAERVGAVRWNRLLRRIIESMSADLDLRAIVQRVAELITDATDADVCFVHLVDEDAPRLRLAGATPPFDEVVGEVELELGEGLAGWVAQHAEPAVVPDKWHDPRYKYIPALRGQDFSSLVSVPMVRPGRHVVGVLNIHSRLPRAWTRKDLALLQDVANLLAGIVDNARLHARLALREEALERFAVRVVEAQELERRRLAGDIHDGISQRIVSLWYHLSAAEEANPDEPATVDRELAAAKELATATLDETRVAIAGLRPAVLDDLGLGPSLESLARSLPDLDVELAVDECRLPPHVETAVYRIAQEALQNVVKHARASRVHVELRTDGRVVALTVADDGRGFDTGRVAEARHPFSYGLASMRERAELMGARFRVESAPGRGTTVAVVVPTAASQGAG